MKTRIEKHVESYEDYFLRNPPRGLVAKREYWEDSMGDGGSFITLFTPAGSTRDALIKVITLGLGHGKRYGRIWGGCMVDLYSTSLDKGVRRHIREYEKSTGEQVCVTIHKQMLA